MVLTVVESAGLPFTELAANPSMRLAAHHVQVGSPYHGMEMTCFRSHPDLALVGAPLSGIDRLDVGGSRRFVAQLFRPIPEGLVGFIRGMKAEVVNTDVLSEHSDLLGFTTQVCACFQACHSDVSFKSRVFSLKRDRMTEVGLKFSSTLQEGILLRRFKRFFAEIDVQGRTILAHVPNTGSMKGCSDPGSRCRFTTHDDPKRKLQHTLEMVQTAAGTWVGVNTQLPNKLVRESLTEGLREEWMGFDEILPEYRLSPETRLDFALRRSRDGMFHFIEVKNVTLAESGVARFPDAVTTRGQKHLRELIQLVEQGNRAELVFTVQREDVRCFSPAVEIDPEYGRLLRRAHEAGVWVTPLLVRMSPTDIVLTNEVLPISWS